ncbi:MAG TPA: hypothetical protein VHA30_03200 [Patescibacteria group bacterium]|nr:hypothetical protein [Patescibacteria group bacterium]
MLKIHPGSRTLALHYNILVGVEWYGAGRNLYFLPAVAFSLSVINFALYRALRHSERFLAELTVAASLGVQLAVLAAVLLLGKVN